MLPFRIKEAEKGRRAVRMARVKPEVVEEGVTEETSRVREQQGHRTRHLLW